jgi:hypothetical protein
MHPVHVRDAGVSEQLEKVRDAPALPARLAECEHRPLFRTRQSHEKRGEAFGVARRCGSTMPDRLGRQRRWCRTLGACSWTVITGILATPSNASRHSDQVAAPAADAAKCRSNASTMIATSSPVPYSRKVRATALRSRRGAQQSVRLLSAVRTISTRRPPRNVVSSTSTLGRLTPLRNRRRASFAAGSRLAARLTSGKCGSIGRAARRHQFCRLRGGGCSGIPTGLRGESP